MLTQRPQNLLLTPLIQEPLRGKAPYRGHDLGNLMLNQRHQNLLLTPLIQEPLHGEAHKCTGVSGAGMDRARKGGVRQTAMRRLGRKRPSMIGSESHQQPRHTAPRPSPAAGLSERLCGCLTPKAQLGTGAGRPTWSDLLPLFPLLPGEAFRPQGAPRGNDTGY